MYKVDPTEIDEHEQCVCDVTLRRRPILDSSYCHNI